MDWCSDRVSSQMSTVGIKMPAMLGMKVQASIQMMFSVVSYLTLMTLHAHALNLLRRRFVLLASSVTIVMDKVRLSQKFTSGVCRASFPVLSMQTSSRDAYCFVFIRAVAIHRIISVARLFVADPELAVNVRRSTRQIFCCPSLPKST